MLNEWKWKTMRASILVSLVNLSSLAMPLRYSDVALWQPASRAWRGRVWCVLVDPAHSGFDHGKCCRQSYVFVLCKSMHMRRRVGWWAVCPRSSRRTGWVMETENQVSVPLPGERVSRLRPRQPRHHQDTVSLRLYPTIAQEKDFSRHKCIYSVRCGVCAGINWG